MEETHFTDMKKYEITNETHPAIPFLKRIRALKNFSNVKKGELGGFIESEENLDQEGYCWVSGNAKVFGNAKVSEDAEVYGRAKVFGNAEVYEDAEVYDRAKVFGNAMVYGNAMVFGDAVVYEDAEVYVRAKVFGNAMVYGDAVVFGDAEVSGRAKMCGNAVVSGNEKSKPNDNPEILESLPEEVTSITISGITYTKKVTWVTEEK